MGTVLAEQSKQETAMKLFVVLALAAAAVAEPEADPYLYSGVYGGYGYPYSTGLYGYTGYSYPYTRTYHGIGKREAEPEPDPALVYSSLYTPYTAGVYSGYPVTGYTGYTYPYVHAIGKREADAEPEADPALVYSSLYTPYTTGVYTGYPVTGYTG